MRNPLLGGILLVLALAAGGCAVRSISDSGYRANGESSPLYRGELHDLDILGDAPPTAEGKQSGEFALQRGQRLLVVQSGALMPDQDMLSGLSPHFDVGFLSGIPRPGGDGPSYLAAAARGGYDAMLCYWGVLESARMDTAGKALMWVPIAGFFVPDENQRVRIRLKLLVVDVATGRWKLLLPGHAEDERSSSMVTRQAKDQQQVAELKARGYAAACAELVAKFVK